MSDPKSDIRWNGANFKTLLAAADTGGTFGMFESLDPAGSGPPRHIHHREDEVFYILSGEVAFELDGDTLVRGAGDTVFVPRGKEHAYRVLGDLPARMLTMITPGGFEGFFADVARDGLRIPRDMDRIAAIGREHHMDFTGPPLDTTA